MKTQMEKARFFRALHARDRAFLIPNPWDAGSARVLGRLGFEALATTSAGYAFSIGQLDHTVDRSAMMAHLTAIVGASDLPVSADLGNGFGDAPETAAETVRLAAMAGVVGGSIEDATGHKDNPIYEVARAVERIEAAAAAARALPFTFTLTARAENYLNGKPNLRDTIQRLQLYQQAGADVLYAPGLTSQEDIAAVLKSVDRPLNVLAGLAGANLDLGTLSRMGVRRVSIGSALCRAAYGAFLRAAREMRERGTFTFADETVKFAEISDLLKS
jgi:2-methylisocitrate lyase-like PEP mutase family enzyme